MVLTNRYSESISAEGQNRSHPRTVNARFLKPGFWHPYSDNSFSPQKSTALTWLCLPYFVLGPYHERSDKYPTESSYPEVTLLQSNYGKTSTQRESQQAASSFYREGLCFSVAKLWCLVVSDGVLKVQNTETCV